MEKHNVPGIYGLDTRMLTKKIREQRLGWCVALAAARSPKDCHRED